jgi:hypothetical protein
VVGEAACVGVDGLYPCQYQRDDQKVDEMEREERVSHYCGYYGIQDCAVHSRELDAADCRSLTLGTMLRVRVTGRTVRSLEMTVNLIRWMAQGCLLVEESLLMTKT